MDININNQTIFLILLVVEKYPKQILLKINLKILQYFNLYKHQN